MFKLCFKYLNVGFKRAPRSVAVRVKLWLKVRVTITGIISHSINLSNSPFVFTTTKQCIFTHRLTKASLLLSCLSSVAFYNTVSYCRTILFYIIYYTISDLRLFIVKLFSQRKNSISKQIKYVCAYVQ